MGINTDDNEDVVEEEDLGGGRGDHDDFRFFSFIVLLLLLVLVLVVSPVDDGCLRFIIPPLLPPKESLSCVCGWTFSWRRVGIIICD